ncbi:hypothetical protein EVJ30_09285 [Exiguobacterium sp. SH5S13]|nr:hypothetical protein EVJ32_02905 [Exiguobacterium sp. SH5S4]TCI52831.1 hypothetical protein EVJ30_09285 [Exiguobacterium sp. SH5S13]TCI63986.1 hypothetical protein EVJ26_06215 [Exiguobacterium sp. SH3S1]
MQNLNPTPRSTRQRHETRHIVTKRVFHSLLIIGFLAFLIGGAYVTLSSEKREVSAMENRELAKATADLTFENVMSGAYMKSVETYVTDHVFNRDSWISLHAFLSKDLFRQTVKNGIYVSADGTMESPMKETIDTNMLLDDLSAFTTSMQSAGVDVYFGLAPNKASMVEVEPNMPDYMGNEAPTIFKETRDSLATVEGMTVMDYRKPLNTADKLSDVFYKTDYHWNINGAYLAYVQTVKQIAAKHPEVSDPLKPGELRKKAHDRPYYGSYARSTTLQYVKSGDTFEWMEPKAGFTPSSICYNRAEPCNGNLINKKPLKSEETYTEMYSLFLHRNWPLITMNQETPKNDTRTLILKDSYANPMLTLLPEHFGHLSVIDIRHFDESSIETYVKDNDIDVVLFIHNVNLGEFIPLYHDKLNE